jgi:hypothetical protein
MATQLLGRDEETMDDPTPEQALAALGAARTAESRLRSRGGWDRAYLLGFALATVPLVLLVGLGDRTATIIGVGVWTVLAVTLALWSRFRTVRPPGQRPRLGRAFAIWTALYAVALAVGLPGFPGEPTFWIIAAVIVPLPLAISAFRPVEAAAGT